MELILCTCAVDTCMHNHVELIDMMCLHRARTCCSINQESRCVVKWEELTCADWLNADHTDRGMWEVQDGAVSAAQGHRA